MRQGVNVFVRNKDSSKPAMLFNGYDYENQAWVIGGKYVKCGHPDSMDCNCYGKKHEGEKSLSKKVEVKN